MCLLRVQPLVFFKEYYLQCFILVLRYFFSQNKPSKTINYQIYVMFNKISA